MLVLLTLPVTILTLGLFIFVLNGLLFWMVGAWLEALERSDLHARLFATPLEIHECPDGGLAVLHLLYCEDAPEWVVVQDEHRLIK